MSLKIKVYNKKAEAVKDLELNKKIFEVKVNNELLHQVVVSQMANARQVLADTKGKSEVSGGGKKPWKQKGTGRARAGSSRSPIWRGGGVTFGPTNDRNFKKKINQKSKQRAMFMVLSERLAEGSLVILDDLAFENYKTKDFSQMISAIETKVLETKRRDILVINGSKDERTFFSARNLKDVKIINPENINALELLNSRYLLLDEKTVKLLEETYC